MPAEMRQVYSSHVAEAGFDGESGELHVVWSSGRRSVYAGVTAAEADQVLTAPSIGEALHAMVRGRKDHRYG